MAEVGEIMKRNSGNSIQQRNIIVLINYINTNTII